MSTCPQVGSMFNDGIWNAQNKTREGSDIPRTMKGEETHYTAFLLGHHLCKPPVAACNEF